jgi:hypothetical protein
MCFSVASACYLDEWRLVNAELDAAEWREGRGRRMECGREGRCEYESELVSA